MTGLLPRSDCPYCEATDLPDYAWWVHVTRCHPEAIDGPDFEQASAPWATALTSTSPCSCQPYGWPSRCAAHPNLNPAPSAPSSPAEGEP